MWGWGIKHRIGMRALVKALGSTYLGRVVHVSPNGGLVDVAFPYRSLPGYMNVSGEGIHALFGDDIMPMSIYTGAGC